MLNFIWKNEVPENSLNLNFGMVNKNYLRKYIFFLSSFSDEEGEEGG